MDYTNVQEYVDKYLKGFLPFKDQKVYQSVISVLRNHFFPYVYDTVPADLKSFVEDQKIGSNLFDKLLLGIGYPSKLVNSLRFTQKLTIIQTLMDYQKYVATPKFIQKVCQNFQENFNVYELYIDYRLTRNDDGEVLYDWIFAPRPIYETTSSSFRLFNYNEIYNATPTYFISKTNLELLRRTNSVALPIKSNLLFLDMQAKKNIDEITQLASATALFYYRDNYFNLFFNSSTYNVTIGSAYQLWYYILYKYSEKVYSPNLTSGLNLLYFNLSTTDFPYTLDPNASNSIKAILQEYDNLPMTQTAISQFYNQYFLNHFQTTINANSYSLHDFRKRVMTSVGDELITIVDDLLDNSDNRLNSALELLGSIEDSLKSHIYSSGNSLLTEYQTYLLDAFPPLLVDPEMTATYQMLTTFKPFHTQLIAKAKYQITSDTKINNAFVETTSQFVVHDYVASAAVISDDFRISYSVETGYFEFLNDDIIKTDINGASQFAIGDMVYSRDIHTNSFPTDLAVTIVEINKVSTHYEFKLQFPYQGLTGVFTRAYKIYPGAIDELIDLGSSGFFTFTNVGSADFVHTNEIGFARFNVGDYIYAPDDPRELAVEIIAKDHNNLTFILMNGYTGSAGSWSKAGRWRPAA